MKTCYLQGSRQKNAGGGGGGGSAGIGKQLPESSPKGSPTPAFVLINQCLAKQTNRCVTLGSLRMLKWPENGCLPVDVINYFMDVEKICDEVYDEQTVGMSIESFSSLCTVDIEPELAINEPGRIAPRIDMDWNTFSPFTDAMLKPIWCRLACFFFDYASFIPDLELLDPIEKNRLILQNSTRIMWLTVAFKTMRLCESGESLLLGLGSYYPLDERALTDNTIFNEIARIVYKECVAQMLEMRLSREEYVLIKAIYFFSPVSNLGDRSLQLIMRLRERYIGLLNDYLLNDSLCNYELALERVTRFMSILQVLEVSSNRFDKRMSHLAIVEKYGMKGKLSYEVHVRE